jgi:predicted amidohydrolase YtcJ
MPRLRRPAERWTAVLAALAVLSLGAGCRSEDEPSRPRPLADATLFHGGTIYLGAPDWHSVPALLVRNGRVVAAGEPERLEGMARGASLERVDLAGGVALPGLQDAHGHWEGLGEALESVDLRGAASYDDVVARVAARAAAEPSGQWITGRGWDQNLWPEKAFPHHASLSAAVPDHPVFLERVDGHAVLVNQRALVAAGLDGAGLDPRPVPGGLHVLDGEGRSTGVLIDAATELVRVPPPDEATRVRRILAAQEVLLAAGLTAVHDMGVDLEGVELMRGLAREGQLRLRGVLYLGGDQDLVPEMAAARASDVQRLQDDLAVVGVKLYADGALGSRGAALLADYADQPGHQGLLLTNPAELADDLAWCARAGLQPAVHAIGDRANRLVLDAFEQRLAADPAFAALRPRVEHAQVVAAPDRGRFAALGVVPSMQPVHCTSDMPWAPERLGPDRIAGAYAWRRLAPDPSALAFGSDFPVEQPSPLGGLYAAVTRRPAPAGSPAGPPAGYPDADQRLTLGEALGAFTAGAARAARQEATRGRLEPGYFADLTVLDRDPFAGPPEELLRAAVRMTVVSGRVVHRADPPGR